MQRSGLGHAVVIGSSIGGLLNARVLSEHFEKVTILERDELPVGPEARRCVPQGQHIHLMLEAGSKVLEELFPGLVDDMLRQGARMIDMGRDVAWQHFGAWRTRYHSGIAMVLSTRTFLEWNIRRRVQALPNVEIRARCAVLGLIADSAQRRVTGVRLKDPAGEDTLGADLVVDASGRGTRAPRWLEALGYGAPEEEAMGIDLAYTSRIYRRPPGFGDEWKVMVQYPRSPESWRAGFIANVEDDRWLVSVNGYFGDHAPTDSEGFLAFARSLPRPGVYDYIRDAEPLTAPVTHKIPTSRWIHYERLRRWPDGFVVTGDAVCAFNPIFGQGMTLTGLGARLLGECLARARSRDLGGLATRFQRRLPRLIRLPWFVATAMDLHYPQTSGARPAGIGLLHWYLGRLLELTSLDTRVYHELNCVLHMRSGLTALLRPGVALPVLAYGLKALFVPLARRANVDTLPPAPALPRLPGAVFSGKTVHPEPTRPVVYGRAGARGLTKPSRRIHSASL
jgi:2-polyprenyl-6-methoxyphenol hydroxylase-like FAD-dependent oxidoreductase